MQYLLQPPPHGHSINVIIVGVGGTGGFVAESVCRLLTGADAAITLIDHDTVEPHNLLRQNFYAGDVGQFKAEVLAHRLARNYDRPIRYSTQPWGAPQLGDYKTPRIYYKSIVIGCVDNAAARLSIQYAVNRSSPAWWIDTGNGRDWGQVLVGNTSQPDQMRCAFQDAVVKRLPDPLTQRPDLLTTVPEEPPDIDCAAALDLTDQDPTINQFMATLATHTLQRILTATCNYMALYVDLERGAVTPHYATPESAARPFQLDPATIAGHHRTDSTGQCPNCSSYTGLRS